MASKKTSTQTRKAPKSVEPRMYGDGVPSQGASTQTGQSVAVTKGSAPARATTSNLRARESVTSDYSYVRGELRRLFITAAIILAGLIALGFVID